MARVAPVRDVVDGGRRQVRRRGWIAGKREEKQTDWKKRRRVAGRV